MILDGTETALACLQYAFEKEENWRVVSPTTLENAGSWGIMKRIGMRLDTRLDYIGADGTPFIVHVMTASEWQPAGEGTWALVIITVSGLS